MTVEPTLTVKSLNLRRPKPEGGSTTILDELDLEIGDHELVSVVGPSGCGKTTLLRVCAGLLEPTGGEARVGGELATASNPKKAVVFQNDSLLPWRRVQDNIAIGLERTRTPRNERHRVAVELAALVGLSGYETRFPHELSGGMRQRANVARALAVDPQVLLMDEPFSALDAQTRDVMQTELLRIWAVGRKTVMFVTHQIDEAVFLSDRVVVMRTNPGPVIADIPIQLERPRHPSVKLASEFQEYVRQVWSLIEPSQVQPAAVSGKEATK